MSNPSGTPCKVSCAGGNACICNDTAKHPHTLHVCKDKTCQCHAAAAQGLELVHDGAGREFYVPQGARLVVRKGAV